MSITNDELVQFADYFLDDEVNLAIINQQDKGQLQREVYNDAVDYFGASEVYHNFPLHQAISVIKHRFLEQPALIESEKAQPAPDTED